MTGTGVWWLAMRSVTIGAYQANEGVRMPTITLFHGTAKAFDSFDPRYALRGSEPNSALGVHLTSNPALAAGYARMAAEDIRGGEPRVLVVEVQVANVALCSSSVDYLGRGVEDDFETTRSASEFVEARLRLQDQGFDAVLADGLDGDLDGCWAVFDPASIRIVETVSMEKAASMEDSGPFGFDCEPVDLHEDSGSEPRP